MWYIKLDWLIQCHGIVYIHALISHNDERWYPLGHAP